MPGQDQIDMGGATPALDMVRGVVRVLRLVPGFVGDEAVKADILDAFLDPHVRDAMVMAAYHLAPTGKRGIHTLEIAVPSRRSRSAP